MSKVVIPEDTRTEEEKTADFADWFINDKNNFSYWYPKIQNGIKSASKEYGDKLKAPRSIVIKVPVEIMKMLFEPYKYLREIQVFVHEQMMPRIPEDMFFIFMKNGTFSNKYDFSHNCKCRRNELEIVNAFIGINYGAACCDSGGISEVVIRDYIGDWNWLDENIPCIYNGMPLRSEFRVFYDFDNHGIIKSANYWDYDYCHDAVERNATDKIIYDTCYPSIKKFYDSHIVEVEELVSDYMEYVNDITGNWSVDIMWDTENEQYWLIDMATMETSAYA